MGAERGVAVLDQIAAQRITRPTPPKAINWSELATKVPPARKWAIKGWFGYGHVTLMVGSGGIGKTLLGQQIGSSLALGQPFVDDVLAPAKVLMWACEDDHDELWRRQVAIAQWLNAGLDAFAENLHIVPRHGLENTLVASEFGKLTFSPLLEVLREQAEDTGAQVVILDNVAQLYGASENDRHAVTGFLNALSGALPGKAILLLAHPARSAGSEFSGSSAWENTVRTRLYLGTKLPDQKVDQDEPPQDDVRYLSRRKANYSNKDWRRFNYRDGVLVPEALDTQGGVVAEIRQRNAEKIVLEGFERLKGMGVNPTEATNSTRFLPRLLQEYEFSQGFTRQELAGAMRRQMVSGKLRRAQVGRGSDRHPVYGLEAAQ